MKKIIMISLMMLSFILLSVQVQAAIKVGGYDWQELTNETLTQFNKQKVNVNNETILKISADQNKFVKIPVLSIADPKIQKSVYAIWGMIKYENVLAESYLELLSHFPNQGAFYTKTLGVKDSYMEPLIGSADWHPVILPFYIIEKGQQIKKALRPNLLELNLVLPKGGVVYFKPMTLMQYDSTEDPVQDLKNRYVLKQGAWWNKKQAGYLGAVFGVIVGLFGAVIGILSSKAKAKKLVMFLMVFCLTAGFVLLALGSTALCYKQPYEVYYPLLLGGGILVLVMGINFMVIRRKYQMLELKKMQAKDS